MFGQAKINENIAKKLAHNDKMIETISSKMEGLTSAVKNQLSFNKMMETQLAQIVAAIPTNDLGKIPGQPDVSLESVKVINTRYSQSPSHPVYHYYLDPPFMAKKEDPGRPTITCAIGEHRGGDKGAHRACPP